MKILLHLVLIVTSSYGYSQYSRDRYLVDSLQQFSPDKLTYEFNIDGPTQGLYFDKYLYKKLPNISLKIYNNTNDTLIKVYRERDAHLMWIRTSENCGRCDTLLPNDYFVVRSGWASWQNPRGIFSTTLNISYRTITSNKTKECIIRTWGEIYPRSSID